MVVEARGERKCRRESRVSLGVGEVQREMGFERCKARWWRLS